MQAFCAGPRTLDAKLVWQGKWGHSHLSAAPEGQEAGPHPAPVRRAGYSYGLRTPRPGCEGQDSPQPTGHAADIPPAGHLRATCGRRKPACLPEVPCLGAQQPRPLNPDAAKSCSGRKGSNRRLWSLTAPPRDEPLLKHPENYLLSAGHTGHRHLANSQTHTQQPL